MNNYISFTAVVPSFNQGQYLEETLLSLINQNYPKLNIVVMDGGSTDNSVEIIKRYESKLAYWTSEKDKGQTDAISRGFQRAKGDWLLWLNSDDALFPNALFRANEIIQATQPDIITGSACTCDENSKIIRFTTSRPLLICLAKQGVQAITQPATFFKRTKYEEIGGLRLSLHMVMDTELWTRMICAGAKIAFIREPLAFFRKHGDTKTATLSELCRKELYDTYGLSAWRRKLMTCLFQSYSLLHGVYLRNIIMTEKVRGSTIAEIWSWKSKK